MLAYYLLLIVNNSPLQWRNRLRDLIFSTFGGTLSDLEIYRQWLSAKQYFSNPNDKVFVPVQLSSFSPAIAPSKKIAIHFHVYYIELAKEALAYFEQFPVSFDLLISCTSTEDLEYCISLFKDCSTIDDIQGKVVKNQGRDLAPLVCDFAKTIANYDYFAHIHTKKSLEVNAIGDAWRQYLFSNLLSAKTVPKILTLLKSYSIVYPKTFDQISYEHCIWGMSYPQGCELSVRMGLQKPIDGYIQFPVGSMFWAQVKAFEPLFALNLTTNDFEVEMGQTHGTLAHSIERLLATIPTQTSAPAAIIYSGRVNQ